MLTKVLQALNSSWQKLSARERRLAAIVGVLCAVMLAVMVARGAWSHVQELDRTVSGMQQNIVNCALRIAHKQSVEAHYARVAAQHSSAWTEAEIQDRLRQEIYRLAQKSPPPLDENGIPLKKPNELGNLVEIPALQEGTLSEGGEGYREYRLSFQVPNVELDALINFLERLQDSPQSLRIDGLEMYRTPLGAATTANIDITRIIVDGSPTAQHEEESDADSTAPGATMDLAEWRCLGGDVLHPEAAGELDETALRAQSSEEEAELFLVQSLPAGAVYEMAVDMTASGKCRLAIGDLAGNREFADPVPVRNDGTPYRYRVQFTVPGASGTTRLRAPFITFEEAGAYVHISQMTLRKVVG